MGADCSLKGCPKGKAWADVATAKDTAHGLGAECSNAGICNRATGQCACLTGFEGTGCARTKCADSCMGHGTCKSIRKYAKHQRNLYTLEAMKYYHYTNVWDADMMYGCDCDDG